MRNGHGFHYKPYKEWIEPLSEVDKWWMKHPNVISNGAQRSEESLISLIFYCAHNQGIASLSGSCRIVRTDRNMSFVIK